MSKRLTTLFALFGLNVPKSNFHSLNFVYKIISLFFNILNLLLLKKIKNGSIFLFFLLTKFLKYTIFMSNLLNNSK